MENEISVDLTSICENIKDMEMEVECEVDKGSQIVPSLMQRDNFHCLGSQTPRVGMLFASDLDAFNFYNRYALMNGFSVRKNKMYRNAAAKIKRRDFCCSWEGQYKKKATPKKRREERRCGCKAMLMIRMNDDEKYVVTSFVEEHNHVLVEPVNAYQLRSHRQIQPSQKSFIKNMRSSGIKTKKIISYLSVEAGRAENLNFIESDCYNTVSSTRTAFLKEGDAQCLLQYLSSKKEANKFFFSKLRTDEENRLCGVFIADAKSRCDYAIFGDVVCFDTTFKTNNYSMTYAPIIGVNHNGQTVLFGCGLLDSETTDSFKWFFETFLEAMEGKHPETIFTDQAMSIANVLRVVLPNTHHRLCLWHIYQNAAKHLSKVFSEFDTFAADFKNCIYNPETVDEFEECWKMLLSKYGLEENPWLKNLYKLKTKWAQVYARNHFCAAMTTTQTSESINSFLKKFFSGNLILREFVTQYENALASWRLKERSDDTNNKKTKANLATRWAIEIEASQKYTRKIFHIFQQECLKSFVLKLEAKSDDGETCCYRVRRVGGTRFHSLTYKPSNQLATCSCKKFEFHGILCAHILKLFLELEVSSLPSMYYLKRWTMGATTNIVYDSRGNVIQADLDPTLSKRYSDLSHCAQTLIAKGARTTQKCDLAMSEMLCIISRLDALSDSEKDECAGHNSHNPEIPNEDKIASQADVGMSLLDPVRKKHVVQGKGREKGVLESKPRKRKAKVPKQNGNDNGALDTTPVKAKPAKGISNTNAHCIKALDVDNSINMQGTDGMLSKEPQPLARKLEFSVT